jgi:hypothetical protein
VRCRCGRRSAPCGEPPDVSDLPRDLGGQHWTDADQLDQGGLGLLDGRLEALLDAGDAVVEARTSRTRSTASCRRVLAGGLVGRTRRNRAAAVSAVSFRPAPAGTSSASSRCSRLRAWVRVATRSSRRSDSSRSTVAWSWTPTWCSRWLPRAARAIETASPVSWLRPWPVDSSRTRAASLAGTSMTCSPSATSCWARTRPTRRRPRSPSAAAATVWRSGAGSGGPGGWLGTAAGRAARHAGQRRRRCGCVCAGQPRSGRAWTTFAVAGRRFPGGQADFGQGRPLTC